MVRSGGNYTDPYAANPEIESNRDTNRPAEGIIYWAKFWDKDLGEKNCSALSSWPHEKIPFYLSGYDSGVNWIDENNQQNPSR